MSINPKTKISDTGVVDNLLIHARCDLDFDISSMITIHPAPGSASMPSGGYSIFSYNPANGSGISGVVRAWGMKNQYPRFKGEPDFSE